MRRYSIFIFVLIVIIQAGRTLQAQNNFTFNKYHNPLEVESFLKQLNENNPSTTRLNTIALSPGGIKILVLEIGMNPQTKPAIFVGANFEGNVPIATEGALGLAKMLIDSAKFTAGLKWYIMPMPNPDALQGYFATVKYGRTVNDFSVNNDMDEAVNEDGYEDLNGDGVITQMRVKDITGNYITSSIDHRIMVLADPKKGERGLYKLYSEGIDNDGDGEYNEDGEGGINIGISFPHLFPKNNKEAGLWPGQSPEVYGIMKFIYDRPNIAMVYTLGSSDYCSAPPRSGRKGDVNVESIQIPNRYANLLGADPAKSYKMDEVIELMKVRFPNNKDITPSYIANFLGLGEVVNPIDDDLKFYVKLSADYRKYLKSKQFSVENLDPAPDKDGSFELWAYYQLGVPSFAMNLFTVPKIKAKEEKKGEEKKVEKENDLSEKDASLLAYADKEFGVKGFIPWQTYKHPTLGTVEIGGYAPYLETTPKATKIDSILKVRLPWLLQLSKNLPEIAVADQKVTDLGAGVYQLELFVENKGTFPYPTAMGERNKQPAPIIIVLDGDFDVLQGLKRTPLGAIGGNQVKKLTWILKINKNPNISLKLESVVFGTSTKQIKIGG